MTTWRRPANCDTSSCPELMPRDGWPGEIVPSQKHGTNRHTARDRATKSSGGTETAETITARRAVSMHVLPVGDLIEHETTDECPCGPRSEIVKREDGSVGWVVVHHALDGREALEVEPQ
jgi:hypothetical protein